MTRGEKEAQLRVVGDANVVIPGHLSVRGASRATIEPWRQDKSRWIISEDILEEMIEKLLEKRISRRRVEAFVLAIRILARMTNRLYEVDAVKADPETACSWRRWRGELDTL